MSGHIRLRVRDLTRAANLGLAHSGETVFVGHIRYGAVLENAADDLSVLILLNEIFPTICLDPDVFEKPFLQATVAASQKKHFADLLLVLSCAVPIQLPGGKAIEQTIALIETTMTQSHEATEMCNGIKAPAPAIQD